MKSWEERTKMRLPNEYDDEPKMSAVGVYSIIGVSLFVTAVLILVLVVNNKSASKTHTQPSQKYVIDNETKNGEQGVSDSHGYLDGKPILSPDDLDFWDMYPEEKEEVKESGKDKPKQEIVEDPATDGKHTLITYADGKEEWVLISPYLTKHEYDFTKLVCQSNIMKYYVEGKQVSYLGADISKYHDYVDFVKLKKAGVNYVMLRVGARGYGSGQLMLDDYFTDNIKRATDAGLYVGVYFFSQAITKEEAVEEAEMVIEYVKDYKITYPVAFDMEFIENDTSRIDNLSRDEKTTIAKEFLETIKAAGYKPMIYGNKEWLIKRVDLSKLSNYDIWLSQTGDIPDYPYRFTMWQYSTTASLDGIAGYANLNISFIDYSEK